MTRRLRELVELRETEEGLDGFINEVRFFRVSKDTYKWLEEHGQLAAINLCDWMKDTVISVSAELDPDIGWGGWHWLHDEMLDSGMNPALYGL